MATMTSLPNHDESCPLGPGSPSAIERAAGLAREIATITELLRLPDWHFGCDARRRRVAMWRELAGHRAALREIEERMTGAPQL